MNMSVVAAAVVLASFGALGAPRRLAVTAGDCRNPELLTAAAEFQRALRSILKDDAYEPEVVLDIIRPRPTRSLEDVRRQVDSARTLYYGGQADRALDLLRQALTELERASPEVSPWEVTRAALELQGNFAKALGKRQEVAEAFGRLLRVEPEHRLDPDQFTPSTVQAFEAIKKDLGRVRRMTLVVNAKAGASVFLDGRLVGKAPLRIDLVPATYRLSLLMGEQVSFARTIDLKRDEAVNVDLDFEGGVSTRAPLCISALGENAQKAAALTLAATVNAEDLIIFRIDSARGDPPYFHATLSKVSPVDQVREASVKFNQLSALAWFIATGKPIPGDEAPDRPSASVPAPAPSGPSVSPPPPPSPGLSEPRGSAARSASSILMGAGAAALAAGVVVYAVGANGRASLAEQRMADGRLFPPEDKRHRAAQDLIVETDANRAASFALLGGGLGALAVGLATYFLFPPEAPAAVSLAWGNGALAIGLEGRW